MKTNPNTNLHKYYLSQQIKIANLILNRYIKEYQYQKADSLNRDIQILIKLLK